MQIVETLLAHDWMHTLLGCLALLVVAWAAGRLARYVMTRIMTVASRNTPWQWDDAMVRRGVFKRLAQVIPLLIVRYGIAAVPNIPPKVESAVVNIALALVALFVVLAVNAALSALEDLYRASPPGKERSIKGYIQLLKIIVYVIGLIVVIASLIDRSPLTLLAGLGAVSAVVLLIFKDTILSVVASIQLASNDMLRVGDWISMPSANTDGFVVDIALHTVKVQNWDKTISTVPTWNLISDSYRNWRGMYESGGRRIRRALNIDLTSVRFLSADEVAHLREFSLLAPWFDGKQQDLSEWNGRLAAEGKPAINQRRLTNIGAFRAYVQAYVDHHPGINHDLFWAVRQLDPGPTGIPLQVYAYTAATDFVPHENVQGDIFDHLIAIIPEFGLRLFQEPSGADLRRLAGRAGGPSHPDHGPRAVAPQA